MSLSREFPLDTRVQKYWLPTIEAAIELERHKPDKAIDVLQPTTSYELASLASVVLMPIYVRGQAYLALHNGTLAAAEFEKLLHHKGILTNR